VEDQQPDSGDLTTDAQSPDQPADAAKTPTGKAARHRHRMPLRKELAANREDAEDTATDDQASADAEPELEAAEAEPAPPRRRWSLFRRRTKAPEPETVSEPADEVAEPAQAEPEPEPAVDETTETAEAEEAPDAQDAPAEEQIVVPHRPAGKRLTIAAAAAGVVFVGATAFAGATLQPYLADRALVHTKLDIARTAANAITTLWTYTPDNMEQLADRSSKFLGGDFRNEYSKYIDAIVPTNKQAQVSNNTEVVGAAVESLNGPEATAIVYTNSTATSPLTKNIPSMRYLSYRLTLHRDGPEWLVTGMTAITNLDLTPKI
jgi:Mce-associated membrane protein